MNGHPISPTGARQRELDAREERATRRNMLSSAGADLPRLELATVTALDPICPICGGRRRWARATCSHQCSVRAWAARHRKTLRPRRNEATA